jgi:pseudouridine synthase
VENCRIQKWLAACGVASRRHSEHLIREGRVTVNGQCVTQLGTLCDPERDVVAVDGRRVQPTQEHVYLAVHKPRGYVSTVSDPHAKRRVIDLAPPEMARRVKPVGRLDKESEGLILLTDDGRLINRLTHPRFHVEKEYEVRIAGALDERAVEALRAGVRLEEGPARAIEVTVLHGEDNSAALRIVLAEGRKRQIRRMMAAVGCRVEYLRRVRIGPIRLGALPQGHWRHLTKVEVRLLYQTTETELRGKEKHEGWGDDQTRPTAPTD